MYVYEEIDYPCVHIAICRKCPTKRLRCPSNSRGFFRSVRILIISGFLCVPQISTLLCSVRGAFIGDEPLIKIGRLLEYLLCIDIHMQDTNTHLYMQLIPVKLYPQRDRKFISVNVFLV